MIVVITTVWDIHLWLWPEHCKMPVLCCSQPDRYKFHHLLVGRLGQSVLQLHLQKWSGHIEWAGLQTERKRYLIHQPQISKALLVFSEIWMPNTSLHIKVQSQTPLCAQPLLSSDYNQQQPSTKHNVVVRQSSPSHSLCAALSRRKRTKVYLWFSLRWTRQEMCVCFRHCLHLVICLKLDKLQLKLDGQNLLGMEKHMKSSKVLCSGRHSKRDSKICNGPKKLIYRSSQSTLQYGQ